MIATSRRASTTAKDMQSHRGDQEREAESSRIARETWMRRGDQDREAESSRIARKECESSTRPAPKQSRRGSQERRRHLTRLTEKRSHRGDRHSRRFDRERRRLIPSKRDTTEERSAPRRDIRRDSISSRIWERKREDDPSRERENGTFVTHVP